MQLKYDELASGRYDVQCDEKPLEHVLFADEEQGYCLLGATDLQGNLLAAADPDAGYPYETVRVEGAIRIAAKAPALESPAAVRCDGTPFSGGSVNLGEPGATVLTFPVTAESFPPEQLFANLKNMPVFAAAPIPLRTFGLKLELKEGDLRHDEAAQGTNWAGELSRRMGQALREQQAAIVAASLGYGPPVVPPPAPQPAAERVGNLLRLRSVPGYPARFTVCLNQREEDPQEYLLDEYRVFDAELQLKLEPRGGGDTGPPRYFLIKNPQTNVQLHREHVPGGPPIYDPGTGCMVPSPVECGSQLTLHFSPGAMYLGPLTEHEHWGILEGLLDSLIESGADDEEDEEDEEEGGLMPPDPFPAR